MLPDLRASVYGVSGIEAATLTPFLVAIPLVPFAVSSRKGLKMEDLAALFDALSTTTGKEWRDVSDELKEAGFSWEWTFHRDGTDVFALKDHKPE